MSSPPPSVESLFASHRQQLWAIAYRMMGCPEDADDLVQETFQRAIERPPSDRDRPWRPWLVKVVTNLAIDALRRRQRAPYPGVWLPTPTVVSTTPPAPTTRGAEQRYSVLESASLAFLHALEALTPPQRAVLILRDVIGYSGRETADCLDLKPGHVRVLLHRARGAMADHDRRRAIPEPDRATRDALQRFMTALISGDVDALAAQLAEDVRVYQDSAGEFLAARNVISGARDVARFYLGLTRKGPTPVGSREVWIGTDLAFLFTTHPHKPRHAPRVLIHMELDTAGRIHAIFNILATAKLSRLPPPAT